VEGELRVDLATTGGRLGESVGDFWNEGVVFDERVIGEWLGSADTEPDERQRDPVIQLLDNAGIAEDVLLRRYSVCIPCHSTWHTSKVCGFRLSGKDERSGFARLWVLKKRRAADSGGPFPAFKSR
jgi:hypothetical protein